METSHKKLFDFVSWIKEQYFPFQWIDEILKKLKWNIWTTYIEKDEFTKVKF